MDMPADYVHWGFVLISAPNLIIIATMVAVFVAALLAPFPAESDEASDGDGHG